MVHIHLFDITLLNLTSKTLANRECHVAFGCDRNFDFLFNPTDFIRVLVFGGFQPEGLNNVVINDVLGATTIYNEFFCSWCTNFSFDSASSSENEGPLIWNGWPGCHQNSFSMIQERNSPSSPYNCSHFHCSQILHVPLHPHSVSHLIFVIASSLDIHFNGLGL